MSFIGLTSFAYLLAVGRPQAYYSKGDFIYQILIAKAKLNLQTIWGFSLHKKEMGVSILLYVNQMRIYHSIFDIQKTNFSVTRIAIENGFSSLEYFSEMFFKIMGVSPRVYKNYYCCRFKVSEQELEAIRSHWADLQSFVNFVGDYKKNRKPLQAPVLKRSIFN